MATLTSRTSSPSTVPADTASPSRRVQLLDLDFLPLEFPSLNEDGSIISTRPRPAERTPPAALISQRLANMEASTSALSDDYDMMDDLVSNGETASIASTDAFSDGEEQDTPDDGSNADVEEAADTFVHTAPYQAGGLGVQQGVQKEQTRAEQVLQSFLSEDLETPRQSTLHEFPGFEATLPKTAIPNLQLSKGITNCSRRANPISKTLKLASIVVPLLSLLVYSLVGDIRPTDPLKDLYIRRAMLTSITEADSRPAFRLINVTHLLPEPTLLASNSWGYSTYGVLDLITQRVNNTLFISSPKNVSRPAPFAWLDRAYRADTNIPATRIRGGSIMDGIAFLDFNAEDAYGTIGVDLIRHAPHHNLTTVNYFGRRSLHQTQKELTNVVSKDVSIVRRAAKSLTDRLQLELGASVAATRNVTTQLAVEVSRELQVFVNTAVSVFDKAAAAGNKTAVALSKEVQLAQHDIIAVSSGLSTFVSSATASLKKAVRDPLLLSRERAIILKDRILHRKSQESSCIAAVEKSMRVAVAAEESARLAAVKSHSKLCDSVCRKPYKAGKLCARKQEACGCSTKDTVMKSASSGKLQDLKLQDMQNVKNFDKMLQDLAKNRGKRERKAQKDVRA